MEVVSEAVAEEKKEVPAEDTTKQLTDAYDKAKAMAVKLNALMLGQWFTKMKLSAYAKIQLNQVEKDLQFLAPFFFLENKWELGVEKFHVLTDPKERLEFIEINRIALMSKIDQFDLIAQLIADE